MQLNKSRPAGQKQGIEYFYDDYGTCFCQPLDQSNLIGGGHEEGRNQLENPQRLERVRGLIPAGDFVGVLDFGCGHGLLVDYLKENGIKAQGYDKFNPDFNFPLAAGAYLNSYSLVTLIEVIEHLQEPFSEIDDIFNCLKPGGKVMIETSFTDWLGFEADYINPAAGHNTVWSHAGLTAMMIGKGFQEGAHFNRNVRIYVKP